MTNTTTFTDRNNVRDLFILNDLASTDYGSGDNLKIDKLLKDLKRLLVYTMTPQVFYLKEKPLDEIMIMVRSLKEISQILKDVVIDEYEEHIQTGKNT